MFLSFSVRGHRCRWLLVPWRRWHCQSSGGNEQLGKVSVIKKSTSGVCQESCPFYRGFLPTSSVRWQISCVALLQVTCKSLLWIWEQCFFQSFFIFKYWQRREQPWTAMLESQSRGSLVQMWYWAHLISVGMVRVLAGFTGLLQCQTCGNLLTKRWNYVEVCSGARSLVAPHPCIERASLPAATGPGVVRGGMHLLCPQQWHMCF